MDLRSYYRKIRELESSLPDEFPIVRSLPTEAGGQGGRLTETPRSVAARMIVDGVAEAVSEEEAQAFRAAAVEAQQREEERRRAEQVQFTILSEADVQKLTRSSGRRKES